MARIASATLRPCDTGTSACRSLATIASGVCPFFFAISVLLRFEAIPQDGPLQRGRITFQHALRPGVVGLVVALEQALEVAVRADGDGQHLALDPAVEALRHAVRLRRVGPGGAVLRAEGSTGLR